MQGEKRVITSTPYLQGWLNAQVVDQTAACQFGSPLRESGNVITRRTTLVLGAGASKPYGFPLGWELKSQILSMDRTSPITHHLTNHEIHQLSAFCEAFRESRRDSIDAFLSVRTEFAGIGTRAIAYALLTSKRASALRRDNNRGLPNDWCDFLWNKVADGCATIDDLNWSNLSIVTFNYDRSLEVFLHRAMEGTFGADTAAVQKKLSELRINHVYGQLGHLWGGEAIVPFGAEVDRHGLDHIAANLKVIPEARDDDESFERARAWLEASKAVCFLGFGFDQLNLRRLDASRSCANPVKDGGQVRYRVVEASCMGKTDAEVRTHAAACGVDVTHASQLWVRGDCVTTLRERLPLE